MEQGPDRWPSHRRRRRLSDLNADEPDDTTEEYYNNSNHDCSSDSEETISDTVPASNDNDNGGGGASSSSPAAAPAAAAAAAAETAMHACPFCWKEFRSHKAVCGHMKVHREQQGVKINKGMEANKRSVAAAPAVGSRRWGAAASNRGCSSGSRGRTGAASTKAESDQSMAAAVLAAAAESKIVLQPKPLAFAAPNPPSPVPAAPAMFNDSSESRSPKPMVARRANPPKAEAILVHPHAAPPPPAGERQNPKGYTCKKCGMWFRTHQGLGGHMVGHKNRERAATGAVQDGAAAAPHRGDAKPAKMHVCKFCGAEFPGGVQLGGHMRKHWPGPPITKKPRRFVVQPLLPPVLPPPPPPSTTTVGVADADLTLALPVKAEEALPAPAEAPVAAGRVLLFGIDIGPGVQTPAAKVEHRLRH